MTTFLFNPVSSNVTASPVAKVVLAPETLQFAVPPVSHVPLFAPVQMIEVDGAMVN